ncbi:MAG: AAA family ATPase [Phycisphaerales bacterium]
MRTIAVVNQKGGCGKTTTAINLAAELASRGHRTLLVDMDPQSHCASGLGVPHERIERDISDALFGDPGRGPDPAGMLWEVSRNLYLAPSSVRLAAAEAPQGPMANLPDRDRRLLQVLTRLRQSFEFCLIDCPPQIGLLAFNALRAADEALVPVETGFFSLQGADQQWKTIRKVAERVGRVIPVRFLPTLHNPNRKVARDVMQELRSRYGDALVPTCVHEHDVLREAVGLGCPVREHAPGSTAAADFMRLADWLLRDGPMPPRPIVEIDRNAVTTMLGQGRPSAEPDGLDPSLGRQGGRVAELIDRLRRVGGEPPVSPSGDDRDGSPHRLRDDGGSIAIEPPPVVRHPMGVSFEEEGVRFAQPASGASSMAVVADFGPNFGVGTQTFPMRFDERSGTFAILIAVPPGSYEYRLVIDDSPSIDPFNLERVSRPEGEANLLRVPGR